MSTAVDASPDRPSGRGGVTAPKRRAAGLLLVIALLLVAGVGSWRSASGARIDAVHVVAVPGGVTCSVGDVTLANRSFLSGIGSPEEPMPVMAARPGMRCAVRLQLVNTGGSDVRITSMVIPHGGPASRIPVRLAGVEPGEVSRADSDIDAVVQLDDVLRAGTDQVLTLRFEYREDGCHGPSSAEYVFLDGPYLRVQALGRSAEVAPAQPVYGASPYVGGSCS